MIVRTLATGASLVVALAITSCTGSDQPTDVVSEPATPPKAEPSSAKPATGLSAEAEDKLQAIEALGVGNSTRRVVEQNAERNQQLEDIISAE